MKVKIDKSGNLWIERAGKMKAQNCPHGNTDETLVACGDWCPMFQEPADYEKDDLIFLQLCQVAMTFNKSEFTDERNK